MIVKKLTLVFFSVEVEVKLLTTILSSFSGMCCSLQKLSIRQQTSHHTVLCHVRFSQENTPEPIRLKYFFIFSLREEKFPVRIPKTLITEINLFNSLLAHRHYAEMIRLSSKSAVNIEGILCLAMYFENCSVPGYNVYIDYNVNGIH